MLIMFRVKNFASFKNEVILDMRAVSYKKMTDHTVKKGKNNILKTLALHGKNASGKSNLISALYFFESFVFNQFYDARNREDDVDKDRIPGVRRSTFMLSEEKNNDSEFEIIFFNDNKTYQYGFVIHDNIDEKKYYVKEEWLYVDDKMVFERNENKILSGKKYENIINKINKFRDDMLYVGVLDYFSEGEVREIVNGIKGYLKNQFNVHFELIIEGTVKGVAFGVRLSDRLAKDKEYKEKIEKFIKAADIGIKRLSIEENLDEKTKERLPFKVKSVHDVYNDDGKIVGEEKFDLNLESSGTIRYFSFIQYILDIIENGGVFIVDELSARLHPILTKYIVDLFQNEQNKNAQLIYTTHDISLMNKDQYRRDEVAFIDKNERGESSIYSLAQINVRSDASFSKDYLSGKYGAIPVVEKENFIKGDNENQENTEEE